MALLAQIFACRGPHAHKIAHRFMHRVGNPDPFQLAGPQQPRQADRIAPVGLDRSPGRLGISEGATTLQR
ncbi:hypothetical protein NKJ15_27245 [Mesorhizobium sp. M0207]